MSLAVSVEINNLEPLISDRNREDVRDRSVSEQNRFLDHCHNNGIEVTVYLMSGTHFIGIVVEHDRKSLLLGGRSRTKEPRLIQKNYIALIRPNEPIELFIQYRGMGTALSRRKKK